MKGPLGKDYVFVVFPNGPFILMMVNYNQNIVSIQYKFGEEVVLMGAGLFLLQTKLRDICWQVVILGTSAQ